MDGHMGEGREGGRGDGGSLPTYIFTDGPLTVVSTNDRVAALLHALMLISGHPLDRCGLCTQQKVKLLCVHGAAMQVGLRPFL